MTEPKHEENHGGALGSRLNWLRAAVLGANDGIVSTAGLVVGVAGATGSRAALLTAGLAGLLAGSMSMAAGEYVSVSTQRDSELAALAVEKRELREQPEAELRELTEMLQARGLSEEVAGEAAEQLTERDALRAHASVELGIDPDELTNPWHAAWASFLAFTVGALLPLLAIVLPPAGWRLPVTVLSVLAALVLTGWTSARLGAAAPGGRCCAMWAAGRWRWRSRTRRAACWGRSACEPGRSSQGDRAHAQAARSEPHGVGGWAQSAGPPAKFTGDRAYRSRPRGPSASVSQALWGT
ncbi:Predicted Fe2+/Mn2+ transporter, VIT1/CCC1 family [Streptomyces sp. DconLS]|nr:Predicted Fe2+/Mn2+ transporter, VIT1/CCC1 family [Streptomyces sp. DconLS]